jgi:hypothetical protein
VMVVMAVVAGGEKVCKLGPVVVVVIVSVET